MLFLGLFIYIYGIIFKNNTTFKAYLGYLWYNLRYIRYINGKTLDLFKYNLIIINN